jgi:hypothetical protein
MSLGMVVKYLRSKQENQSEAMHLQDAFRQQ